MRNSKNRDKHGPVHVTGRKSFAEVRYEVCIYLVTTFWGSFLYGVTFFTYYFVQMTQKGEAVDKMSVWIKSRNPNDHDVLEAIVSF